MSKACERYCHSNKWTHRVMDIKTKLVIIHFTEQHDFPSIFGRVFQNKIFN